MLNLFRKQLLKIKREKRKIGRMTRNIYNGGVAIVVKMVKNEILFINTEMASLY